MFLEGTCIPLLQDTPQAIDVRCKITEASNYKQGDRRSISQGERGPGQLCAQGQAKSVLEQKFIITAPQAVDPSWPFL